MSDALLRTSLLDLFQALGPAARGVLLGGGYGLYLKQLHLAASGERTLVPAELWPVPRATQDLDLMLSTELVADSASMTAIRAALDKLGYVVIKGAEYLQFARAASGTHVVKVDLLTTQVDVLKDNPAIDADDRRARPNALDRPRLHAHPTDGALLLTEFPSMLRVAGRLSDGTAFEAQIAIPHPLPYLLMKLTAYRDRRHDPDKDLGRHHALDVFRIVAMLTESERDEVQAHLRRLADDAQVRSCKELVRSDFAGATGMGVLAMRRHQLWHNDAQLDVFLETLTELLG